MRPLSATFRDFPQLSVNFREFPRLSTTFRQFPRLSAPVAGAVEKLAISAQFPQIFRDFPQILEVQCALHGCGHCAMELKVHSCNVPGERCGSCFNVKPIGVFPQQQSRMLMQCEQDMQNMTTIKSFVGIAAMQWGWAMNGGKNSEL